MEEKISYIIKFLEERYGEKIKMHLLKKVSDPFKILVWAFLSHRTRDENTKKAYNKLFSKVSEPKDVLEMEEKEIQELIKPSGFFRNKARTLKKMCRILVEKYNGKIPESREELMKLPGVGFKTSAIVVSEAFNEQLIAVDTHVNRTSKRLGIVEDKAHVEEVREKLQELIPKEKWSMINLGLINFGREICKPINPLCIKNKNLCPFSDFCRAYKTRKFQVK